MSQARARGAAIDDEEGPEQDRPMTLAEHLDELRRRLLVATVWVILGTVVCFIYQDELMFMVTSPLDRAVSRGGGQVISTGIAGVFFTALKVSIGFGLFLSGPLVLMELWKFVARGLYAHERKYITLFAPVSYLLFGAGGAFFYFVIQPVMLTFFVDYGQSLDIAYMADVSHWLNLFLGMMLINGIIFQLPLVMVILQLTGLVKVATFTAYRRHFIVGSVVVAAFLTPTGDAITLALTMVPILLLFELGVICCRLISRKKETAK